MGQKKLTKRDWGQLEARAESFGHSIGLACMVPETSDVVEGIYVLFASFPDKIKSVINDNGNQFINFGSDESNALKKKAELEHEGYHVFLVEAKGDATGRMIPSIYEDPVKFTETLFHEGFHNNPRNKMHNLIEESGACFMGIEGAISFFSIFGDDDFLTTSRNRRRSFNEKAQRFARRYQRRLDALSSGEEISASVKFNNGSMIGYRACFLYYPLIRNVHAKVGYLGETRSILTGLPSNLKAGIRKLESLAYG